MTDFAQKYPGYAPDNPSINAPIEAGIKPLCDALNALPGVFTIWSCEGHPERPARPYVTFVADEPTAFEVHSVIEAGAYDSNLHFSWWLTANFRQDGSMQYTIQPNDYRISTGDWSRWWLSRRRNHRRLLSDLSLLAALVRGIRPQRAAVCAKVRTLPLRTPN